MVRPCSDSPRSALRYGVVAFYVLSECNRWAALHIATPFLLTIWSRSAFFGFFMAGIGELLEYFLLTLWETFAVFVTNNGTKIDPNVDVESLANIFVGDWLIQGGIGALLGWTFYQMVESPALLDWQDLWKRPFTFCYYFFWLLAGTFLKGILYSLDFGSFAFGINFAYIFDFILIAILELTQPKHKWGGHTKKQKWIYYFWWLFPVTILHFQNQFDYFYSNWVQSWLWSGIIWIFFMIPYSLWKWRWHKNITFNFNMDW